MRLNPLATELGTIVPGFWTRSIQIWIDLLKSEGSDFQPPSEAAGRPGWRVSLGRPGSLKRHADAVRRHLWVEHARDYP
jgi:hypothetical protein